MKVTAERGGGIAGGLNHDRIGPVDTEAAENGDSIAELVTRVGFFELPDRFPPKQKISDSMWGTLEVEDGDRRHKVGYQTGSEIPDELKEILRLLSSEFGWERVVRSSEHA